MSTCHSQHACHFPLLSLKHMEKTVLCSFRRLFWTEWDFSQIIIGLPSGEAVWSDGVEESAEPGEDKVLEGGQGCKAGDQGPRCGQRGGSWTVLWPRELDGDF